MGVYNYCRGNRYLYFSKFYKNVNKSYGFNTNMSPFLKIVNLNMNSGLKQRSISTILSSFLFLFFLLKHEDNDSKIAYLSSKYSEYSIIKSLKLNSPFYINDVLLEIINNISPVFTLKTNKSFSRKKTKKIKGSNFLVKIAYVKPLSRNLVTLKWLISGANWFTGLDSQTRLFKSLSNAYLGGSNSHLLKKRVKIYQKIIAAYKKKKNG